jgi:hypothetical protein
MADENGTFQISPEEYIISVGGGQPDKRFQKANHFITKTIRIE